MHITRFRVFAAIFALGGGFSINIRRLGLINRRRGYKVESFASSTNTISGLGPFLLLHYGCSNLNLLANDKCPTPDAK